MALLGAMLVVACCPLRAPSAASSCCAAELPIAKTFVLKSNAVHVGNGTVIPNAMVLVRDGRIQAVGPDLALPAEATQIEIPSGCITPGLIDANAAIEPRDRFGSTRLTAQELESQKTQDYLRKLLVRIEHEHLHEHDQDPEHHTATCPVCGGHAYLDRMLSSGVTSPVVSEQSSEVVPYTRILDSIDLDSPDFQRLAQGGVTTVFVSPDSTAVIGPHGAILRTAGADRVVQADGAIKATLGDEPTSGVFVQIPAPGERFRVNLSRRPLTRMSVAWIFRKAFHDALLRQQGLDARGADTPSVAATDSLAKVIDGQIPLRIRAVTRADIETTLRVTDEFKLRFLLEDGLEAYHLLDQLKARSIPVVYGPIVDQTLRPGVWGGTFVQAKLDAMTVMLAAGVDTALSAQDLRDEDGLARQAMYAIRYGLTAQQALQSVTSTPARLLGIDEQVGTVEAGKRADLVLWSGEPFQSDSMPIVVMVGGQLAVDRRAEL